MSKHKGDGIDTCKFCGSSNLWANFFDRDGFGRSEDDGGRAPWDVLCQDCGKFQQRRNRKAGSR
jgi:hypothetical protein